VARRCAFGLNATASTCPACPRNDAATGQYSYTWKTDKRWAGTCRQLVVRLVDGSEHIASFQFR
jgi:hypothetical protein